jgi:hypothetical protein
MSRAEAGSTLFSFSTMRARITFSSGSSLLPHGYQADLCTECAADLAHWFKSPSFDAEGKLE